jgi:hypothetical protein
MYQPLHRHRPAHKWTNGDLAAKVGADLGLPPDDEQRWILDTIYAEKAAERPASFEVAVISPRQNIKTSTLGIAALADLFVFGVERHLWTAHHGDTLKGTFNDFREWIKSNPEYDEQVTFYEGHQDMSIVHKDTGNTIDFQSRTGKAGRGLTGVKRITLDEALYLEPKHVGAVYPTMLTRPGAQVRIGSSAGLLMSEQLRRIRDRGRAGKDKRLAYVEYGATRKACSQTDCSHTAGAVTGCALDDRDLWWSANCALWPGRITEESLADQRASMPPQEFAREFLSWWEDPVSQGGALPYGKWLDLVDVESEQTGDIAFGVDLAGDRDVWVAVAWRRGGVVHVELANEGSPLTAFRVVDECRRLQEVWGGKVATSAFGAELERAGVQIVDVTSTGFAAGCGYLADLLDDGQIRHGNQERLNNAIRVAKWRPPTVSGERALLLKDSPEVAPAAAVARALHGLKLAYTPPAPRRVQAPKQPSGVAAIAF